MELQRKENILMSNRAEGSGLSEFGKKRTIGNECSKKRKSFARFVAMAGKEVLFRGKPMWKKRRAN